MQLSTSDKGVLRQYRRNPQPVNVQPYDDRLELGGSAVRAPKELCRVPLTSPSLPFNGKCLCGIVTVCSDGAAALDAIRKWSPNIAVLDISIPGLTGLEVLASIAAEGFATKVILLAATASDRQIVRAITDGVQGVVLKEEALTELVRCIQAAAKGRKWLPMTLVNAALERETKRRSTSQRLTELLTIRERQVVLLVADGLSNKEIGRRFELSEGTVKIHLHNIYQKLHVNNRTTLAVQPWRAHRDELALPPEEMCSREVGKTT